MYQTIWVIYMPLIIKKKVIWAKNYKIPFRSNLKISDKN